MDACRVVELGLGRIVELDAITPAELRDAVLDLASDEPTAARVRSMGERVREADGTSRAADEIEARLRA
jgi:UDP:flavonoid glycosyltransferase YjiC (YdhE family)